LNRSDRRGFIECDSALAIREIRRRTGLSRNTIRKYLSSDVVEPRYPARKSTSKLDPYAEVLCSWLSREQKRHRKQACSVISYAQRMAHRSRQVLS